ncbi:MAG: reverse transcriptase domain-containing protein [Candidatus Ozemobacteraceae bacterium]
METAFLSEQEQQLLEAYRKLKQEVYFEQYDLFLRQKIADFEAKGEVYRVVHDLAISLDQFYFQGENEYLNGLLKEIKFRMLPKKVVASNRDEGKNGEHLITNIRTSEKYIVNDINYLIDAPVELHILDALWCINVGTDIDKELTEACFGNRLNVNADHKISEKGGLFKLYHFQYNDWRDKAIEKASKLLEIGMSALIISMDIKKCFYSISPEWQEIEKVEYTANSGENFYGLTSLLKQIHEHFHDAIADFLKETHRDEIPSAKQGLPIGLLSSRILCNWILNNHDKQVIKKLNPAFYGRYVDDMLYVISNPTSEAVNSGTEGFLATYLVKTELIKPGEKGTNQLHELAAAPGAYLQKDKLLYYHFDKDHSWAGLREFMENIKHAASEFRFLPEEEEWRELDKCAFDILYEGSANKLRSVIKVSENSTELSKFLTRCLIAHRLTNNGLPNNITQQLNRFWQGLNLLEFFRLWEKYLTLLVIKNLTDDIESFGRQTKKILENLVCNKANTSGWLEILTADLKLYLDISMATAFALTENSKRKTLESEAMAFSGNIRKANLLRHQYVSWPLLNYTNYEGNLANILDLTFSESNKTFELDGNKEFLTPRFLHDSEYYLFNLFKQICSETFNKPICQIFKRVDLIPEDCQLLHLHRCRINSEKFPDKERLTLAIANMKVQSSNILASYKPDEKPNTCYSRQTELFKLLNMAETEKCDLLILPEVSVPYHWLPFMVNHAKRSQIGLVFGLEHWVADKNAHNLLVTVLPYQINDYKACYISVRNKNHFAPGEEFDLKRYGYTPKSEEKARYDLFSWNNTDFTVFNCYELTNVAHRSVFRGRIDLLINVEYNKDTTYYSDLAGTIARDLHCYVVMVNSSDYGDSRIMAPANSQTRDIVQVKGGDNLTLLKTELDIKSLRDFHRQGYSPEDKRFKPKPAGFERTFQPESTEPFGLDFGTPENSTDTKEHNKKPE